MRNILLLAVLAGCAGDDKPGNESPDVDKDGFTVADGDCDDTNATVNPDADEICDGIDNDCDTAIDDEDDSLDLHRDGFFADTDADTHGDPDAETLACEAPQASWPTTPTVTTPRLPSTPVPTRSATRSTTTATVPSTTMTTPRPGERRHLVPRRRHRHLRRRRCGHPGLRATGRHRDRWQRLRRQRSRHQPRRNRDLQHVDDDCDGAIDDDDPDLDLSTASTPR